MGDEPTATRTVYERKDGTWGWQLRSADGTVLATHGANHLDTEGAARAAADRVVGGGYRDAAKRVRRRQDEPLAPSG